MKKIALWKSANDFAFENLATTNAVTLQDNGTKAFVAAGFDQADLLVWNQFASQARQVLIGMQRQKLPSENVVPVAAPTPAPETEKISETAPEK